jgi:hypothetical protein
MEDVEDARFYNFWEGTWYRITENNTLDTTAFFKVRKGVHRFAFEEEWEVMADGKQIRSTAIRVWDKTNKKWGFVWVSDNGLFQVWDSKKENGIWYIYKNFDVNGDKYLSRQAWILQPNGDVLRISEKSYDSIKWEPRFRISYKKIK